MSKAFTKESDDQPDWDSLPPRQPSVLPPGAKNYLTEGGARRMRAELGRLVQVERPALAGAAADDSNDGDAARRLRLLDQRIGDLEAILQSAEIVPVPAKSEQDRVAFGASVTVRESRRGAEEEQYRIVGVDETDAERGWVSWLSPIARALLHARLGERVRFRFPSGEEELEIVRISYEDEGV